MNRSSLACLLVCSAVLAFPQAAAPKAENRITLYVAAEDKSGNPVNGLEQHDFTALDNKQPQQILSFQAASPAGNDSEVVLVLDAVNTNFSRVAFARQQMDNFLKRDGGRLARPVSIAVFTDSGMDVPLNPSIDGNALADFLDKKETGLRDINRSGGFYGASERTGMSLHGLQELVAFEAKRPGRKIVIWISPGWPLLTGPRIEYSSKQQQSMFNRIVGITTALHQARITLYSVNPLGTGENLAEEYYYQEFLKPVKKWSQSQLGDLSLQTFAVNSGGLALNASNDIASLIQRCTRDATGYYVLSFDGPPGDGPNDFLPIEVKVDRPDVKTRTISGYYAQPTPVGGK